MLRFFSQIPAQNFFSHQFIYTLYLSNYAIFRIIFHMERKFFFNLESLQVQSVLLFTLLKQLLSFHCSSRKHMHGKFVRFVVSRTYLRHSDNSCFPPNIQSFKFLMNQLPLHAVVHTRSCNHFNFYLRCLYLDKKNT